MAHDLQILAPPVSSYVPWAHDSHSVCAVCFWKVPKAQAVHSGIGIVSPSVVFNTEYLPAGQSSQCLTDVCSVSPAPCLPAAQFVQLRVVWQILPSVPGAP